ncbi:RNA polymerase subunit sigma-70, partial [Rathayibacter sp. AY1D2]
MSTSTRTWLFAIARNVVIDVHRSRRRLPRLVEA